MRKYQSSLFCCRDQALSISGRHFNRQVSALDRQFFARAFCDVHPYQTQTILTACVVVNIMTPPPVVILGHSFIRRLYRFIQAHQSLSHSFSDPLVVRWHGIGGRTVAKVIEFDLHVVKTFCTLLWLVAFFSAQLR